MNYVQMKNTLNSAGKIDQMLALLLIKEITSISEKALIIGSD